MTDEFYGTEQRRLQDQFESRRLADTVFKAVVRDRLGDEDKGFIASCDFFFLSTVDALGWPTVSYKGGARGFVRTLDDETLAFPNYDGNGMFLSMGNIAASGRIGLLFIDFEKSRRLRVQATASIDAGDLLLGDYPGAQLIIRAKIDTVFVNCPRYVHRMNRVATSQYVPDECGRAPLPDWKRIDIVQNALPPADQGRAAAEGGVITLEDYAALAGDGKA